MPEVLSFSLSKLRHNERLAITLPRILILDYLMNRPTGPIRGSVIGYAAPGPDSVRGDRHLKKRESSEKEKN